MISSAHFSSNTVTNIKLAIGWSMAVRLALGSLHFHRLNTCLHAMVLSYSLVTRHEFLTYSDLLKIYF
jgi:hypothetical protein